MRDYMADMRKLLDAATAEEIYSPARVAEELIEQLAATDPDLLHGFLLSNASNYLRQEINMRDGAKRAHTRKAAARLLFREATNAANAGDKQPLTRFMSTAYSIENGTRIRLSDMYAADLNFIANGYEKRATSSSLQAAFFRTLAAKVGTGRVSDAFDEKKIFELWASVNG